ncbi:MAG: T9SS type A sorting domain-containing protein [Candidatus Edwardsbacteria bacterium]|nr:T9SS type A sorting domain-containing protein [Candidatus Edwardsbacteria bacterium]
MQRALFVCAVLCFIAAVAATALGQTFLESLTPAERANARLSVMPLSEDPGELMDACRRIGALWNDGQYDAALDQFHLAAGRYGEEQLSTTIDWKTPVPTMASKWGTDVRIGNRDSIYELHHDVHRASGNMMAVAHLVYGTGNMYTVNLSTDGGSHWNETGVKNFANMNNHGVGGAFVGDHFYYVYGNGNYSIAMRYHAATGAIDTFSGGFDFRYMYALASSDTVLEVALCSDQDDVDAWLYHAAITKNGQLLFFWSDTAGYSWNQVVTGVTDAAGGLDICYNEGFSARSAWVSYFDTEDSVKIGALNPGVGGWQNVTRTYSGGIVQPGTAIGAYRDTVLWAFNYHSGSALYCHYFRSFNGGGSWAQGNIGEESDSTAMPDVTLRDGGGIGAAYRRSGGTSDHLRYSWRPYSGSWSAPVRLSDSSAFPGKPSIEHLGSGVYGIAYSSQGPVYGGAYFDRSDWVTGVAGEPSSIQLPVLAKVFPSPARDRTTISWSLAQPGKVGVAVYDLTGRLVSRTGPVLMAAGRHDRTLDTRGMAAGVYFVRIEGAGPGYTKKLVVIR